MEQITYIDSLPELISKLDSKGRRDLLREKAVMKFLGRKARYLGVPVFGSFELTPLCNLDCKMCYVHLTKSKMSEIAPLLNTQQWKDIMSQAVGAGLCSADITGGECLTYPGFRELYLHLLSMGVRVSILTNGRLLTQEMVEFFSEYVPECIQVTLYGSNEDAYERVTGNRAFTEVLSGIRRLKEANLPVRLAITVCRETHGDEMRLLELARSLDLPYTFDGAWLDARHECDRQLEDFTPVLDSFVQARIADDLYHREQGRSKSVEAHENCLYDVFHEGEPEGLPCGGAHNSFQVNWKGDLTPCTAFSNIGFSVLENGFNVAWDRLRKAMKAWKMPQECMGCHRAKLCVACPAEKTNSQLDGSLNREVCKRIETYEKEGIECL